MKKTGLILILIIISTFICTACDPGYSDGELLIITTVYALYDFAKEITAGIDGVRIKMLMQPGVESHTYEPTPQDIVAMEKCDLFIYTGGENDKWAGKILNSLKNKDLEKVVMSDIEGMCGAHDEHEGHDANDEHPHEDPHLWTSLRNSRLIVSAIALQLAKIDKDNAELYISNAEKYNNKLDALDKQFGEMIKKAAGDTIIVADRFPLKHFVEDYGLNYFAAFEGCASESHASPGTIAMLSDKVKELNIPLVFIIELSKGDLAATVTEGTNAKIKTFYTCHNVTAADFERGFGYYEMMLANYQSLSEALR